MGGDLWQRSGLSGLVPQSQCGRHVVNRPLVAVGDVASELSLGQASLQGHKAMALLSGSAPGTALQVECAWACRGLVGQGWLQAQVHAPGLGGCWRLVVLARHGLVLSWQALVIAWRFVGSRHQVWHM